MCKQKLKEFNTCCINRFVQCKTSKRGKKVNDCVRSNALCASDSATRFDLCKLETSCFGNKMKVQNKCNNALKKKLKRKRKYGGLNKISHDFVKCLLQNREELYCKAVKHANKKGGRSIWDFEKNTC